MNSYIEKPCFTVVELFLFRIVSIVSMGILKFLTRKVGHCIAFIEYTATLFSSQGVWTGVFTDQASVNGISDLMYECKWF